MNEQVNEQQCEESLGLAVDVSDEALEAAGGGGNGLGGPSHSFIYGHCI